MRHRTDRARIHNPPCVRANHWRQVRSTIARPATVHHEGDAAQDVAQAQARRRPYRPGVTANTDAPRSEEQPYAGQPAESNV